MTTSRATFCSQTLGSILLIIGTCIGAAMLALPVITAPLGYGISLLLLVVCWGVMYLSGLCIAEVGFSVPEQSNFFTMANRTLGACFALISWIAYLLLLYSLLAAYLSAGADLLPLPKGLGPIPWVVVVGALIYWGTARVDHINRFMIFGLFLSFLLLVTLVMPHINLHYLHGAHHDNSWGALPIVITAFGYQVIIPTIRNYLENQKKPVMRSIFWGSFMTLVVYLIWETAIFGLIPIQGNHGLQSLRMAHHVATDLPKAMMYWVHKPSVFLGIHVFVFFALASSFVGIALSLFDGLSDVFRLPKTRSSRGILLLLTLMPPWVYACLYPGGFILALSYAGVFVAFLNILLPALMVWRGRKKGLIKEHHVPGGPWTLWLLGVCAVTVMWCSFSFQ